MASVTWINPVDGGVVGLPFTVILQVSPDLAGRQVDVEEPATGALLGSVISDPVTGIAVLEVTSWVGVAARAAAVSASSAVTGGSATAKAGASIVAAQSSRTSATVAASAGVTASAATSTRTVAAADPTTSTAAAQASATAATSTATQASATISVGVKTASASSAAGTQSATIRAGVKATAATSSTATHAANPTTTTSGAAIGPDQYVQGILDVTGDPKSGPSMWLRKTGGVGSETGYCVSMSGTWDSDLDDWGTYTVRVDRYLNGALAGTPFVDTASGARVDHVKVQVVGTTFSIWRDTAFPSAGTPPVTATDANVATGQPSNNGATSYTQGEVLPTFVAAGAAGTTPSIPAGIVTGDTLFLVTAGNTASPSGWMGLVGSGRVSIHYLRKTAAAVSAPTLGYPGRIAAFRGLKTAGDPTDGASAIGTISNGSAPSTPGFNTTVANDLVLFFEGGYASDFSDGLASWSQYAPVSGPALSVAFASQSPAGPAEESYFVRLMYGLKASPGATGAEAGADVPTFADEVTYSVGLIAIKAGS